MAGLVRKTMIQFGSSGPTSSFGQFGSKELGVPQTSQDPAVIQALSPWVEGWQDAVVSGDKAAYIEDMNGLCFVQSWGLVYLYQMGLPEWDSATLYFTGSIVQTASTGQQFKSLQGGVPGVGAGQSGNTPPSGASNAFWLWTNPPQALVGSPTLNTLQKVTSTSPANGIPGSVTVGDSILSESGGNIVQSGSPGVNGYQYPDGSLQTTAAVSSNAVTVSSPPSAYRTVPIQPSGTSGARALGVIYQNNSSKPLFVSVSTNVGSGATCIVSCDGTTSPTTVVAEAGQSGATAVFPTIFFIVLPNYWYKVLGGTLNVWTEWS